MTISQEDFLKLPYSRVLIRDEDSYAAEILEFPGCFSQGETPDEAISNLDKAAQSWIQAAINMGQQIPEPYVNQGFSGKIALRLPKSLHRLSIRLAERDGVSLNQFLVSAISAHAGVKDFHNHLSKRLENRFEKMEIQISKLYVDTATTDTDFDLTDLLFNQPVSNNSMEPQHA